MGISFGWFSSGRDREAIRLLEQVWSSIQSNFIKGDIDFVFCNRERGEGVESDEFIDTANRFGIDVICFSSRKFRAQKGIKKDQWRREYDKEIIKLIGHRPIDIIVLAGYMLIVSDILCRQFKMINLHPALPDGPKGTWQEVIWEVIEGNKSETGAMMHLVTEELDAGPPISYFSFPIRGGEFDKLWINLEQEIRHKSLNEIKVSEGEEEPLFKKIREEEFKREIPLLVCTLKEISDGEININKDVQTLISESKEALCLNDVIEDFLKNEESYA